MIIIGILTSIVIFSIIVLVHEYGHFKTARIFGVRVEEFGLGIPPRAKKLFVDTQGTLFSLNWLPLGGFVKLTGEHPNSFLLYTKENKVYNSIDLEKDIQSGEAIYDKKGNIVEKEVLDEVLKKLKENSAEYNLNKKPAWQQSIIILAGVCMNFLLSILIFSVLFFVGVKPIGINTQLETDREILLIPTPEQAIEIGLITEKVGIQIQPLEESIAQSAGLQKNDIVFSINGESVNSPEDFVKTIGENAGKKIVLEVYDTPACHDCPDGAECEPCSDSYSKEIQLTPSSDGKIGAYIGRHLEINQDFEYKFGIIGSLKYGVLETYNQTLLTFKALGSLLRKIIRPETKKERSEAIQQVSGPIGIVDFISGALDNGVIFLIIIGAIISINLAVFNLLPIPALDGGRFVFIVLNGIVATIFGKKAIGEKVEGYIHVGFFLFLILLSIVIAYNDILKISNT